MKASSIRSIRSIPTRPVSQWPVGARLRFHPDAQLSSSYEHLRGKPVLVLSELELIGPTVDGRYSWRQQILAYSSCKTGWARPDQLDLTLDAEDAQSH